MQGKFLMDADWKQRMPPADADDAAWEAWLVSLRRPLDDMEQPAWEALVEHLENALRDPRMERSKHIFALAGYLYFAISDRPHESAHDHVAALAEIGKLARSKAASKNPTRDEVLAYQKDYLASGKDPKAFCKSAALDFKVSEGTIRNRLEN